jgi:hypothetical protein
MFVVEMAVRVLAVKTSLRAIFVTVVPSMILQSVITQIRGMTAIISVLHSIATEVALRVRRQPKLLTHVVFVTVMVVCAALVGLILAHQIAERMMGHHMATVLLVV